MIIRQATKAICFIFFFLSYFSIALTVCADEKNIIALSMTDAFHGTVADIKFVQQARKLSGSMDFGHQQELVIIDPELADDPVWHERLSSSQYRVEYLTPSSGGLAALAHMVARSKNLKALHIISHGRQGEFQIAGQSYSVVDLEQHKAELRLLASSIIPSGDILIYGCEIGRDSEGKTLIDKIARLTGRNVAASINTTGSSHLGGDWKLERQSGNIQVQSINVPQYDRLLWDTEQGVAAWFGDTPPLTPSATSDGTGFSRFTTIGDATTGGGGTYDFFPDGTSTLERTQDNTATSLATAKTGNFYRYSTLVSAAGFNQAITYLRFNRTSINPAGAMAGIALYDTVTSVLTDINTGFAINGSGSLVNIPIDATPGMIPGRTYEFRVYVWNCDTCYVDNLRFSTSLNQAPTAQNDVLTTPMNTALNGNLYADNDNGLDTDPEEQILTTTLVNGLPFVAGTPIALTGGALTVINSATGTFSFIPAAGFNGIQTFTYTIDDSFSGTSTATVTITVGSPARLSLTKISNGGVGSFTFTGTNGWADQTLSTVTAGAGASGATQILTSVSTATTITETIPVGYAVTAISCSGIGAGTATPNLAGGSVVLDALATGPGNTIACTFTNAKLPTLRLTKISNGGVGSFTFTGGNGWNSQSITTVTSGTGVAGVSQTLAAASTATTLTETIPAGYVVSAITCSGMGTGAATPNLAAGSVALNAAATAAGNNVACTFTNTKLPTLSLTKISTGGVGAFTFTGTNGWSSQTITTVTPGTGVTGATQVLAAASTATTITETIPAGYTVTAISCTGIGAGTATTNLTTGSVTLNAAATAQGNNVSCTFTNGKLPTVAITKISNGGVGSFTFTGTNGWASQTITTVTPGTAETGVTQPLSAASTATTITEAIPAGYRVTAISCTGLGAGTATPNLVAGSVALNAAATALGNNIACTFTNGKRPTVSVTKVSNGGVGNFTITGTNGWASQIITTITSGTGVTGATQVLSATGAASSLTEAAAANYDLVSASCIDSNSAISGNPATPIGSLAGNVLTIPTANVVTGAAFSCTFTNGKLPTVLVKLITNGHQTGNAFISANTNLSGNPNNFMTTTTPGVASNTTTTVTALAIGTAVSMTENPNSVGWMLKSASCTDTNSAVSGNVNPINATISGNTFTIPSTAIRAGAVLECTMVNENVIVEVRKVTNGGTGTFNFTATNLFANPAGVTTTASGVATPVGTTPDTTIVPTAMSTAPGSTLTVTENAVATWLTESGSCIDRNTAISGNPTTAIGTLSGNTITIPGTNTLGGARFVCTFTNAKQPVVRFKKISLGGIGTFSFSARTNLASTPTSIATVTAGTAAPAAPAAINVTAMNSPVTVTETPAAGFALTGVSCIDANSATNGNTGTFGTFAGNVATIPAANIKGGSDITCTLTNTRPIVRFQKMSLGGTGTFNFTANSNLASTPSGISTTTAGVAAPVAPVSINVITVGQAVTVTESPAAGYTLTGLSCTDANSAVTGNTGTFGSFAGNVGMVLAANIKAGADITCVFTNAGLPTITITKVSNGGVGSFTFTGTNGWASQTISTTATGVGVTGATQTLAAASTATTITETIPSVYQLTAVNCTGLGAGGAYTPNLTTGVVTFDAAATAAGSNIACTFTNGLPTFLVMKSQSSGPNPITAAGQTVGYSILVVNTGTVPLTNITINEVLTQNAIALTLNSGPGTPTGDTNSNSVLDVGETWSYAATYIVAQNVVDNGASLSNIATVDADQTAPLPSSAVVTPITKNSNLVMDKKKNPLTTTPLVAGQIVEYFYDVTNNGNTTMAEVTAADTHNGSGPAPTPDDEALLTDAAPLNDSTDITGSDMIWNSLAPGDTIRFKGTYQVTQADVDALQ